MRPRVVLCGSYHRRPDLLKRLFLELETNGCRILSPISLDFTNFDQSVVVTEHELDLSTTELEKFHLRAIGDADFIMLHVPEGYVGISAAYELGYAAALHKPVFCLMEPDDAMLQTRVQKVTSVFEALEQL